MNKMLPLIIFTLLLYSCEKDDKIIDNNDIKLDSYIIENYSDDAKQLYFHEIYQDSTHTNYTNPILDENEINKILKIIQAVYNSDSPERDTVFDIYDIQGYYCYSFNSISLRVDTGLTEIKNLANNIFPTGEAGLDNLLTNYNFDSVKTSYSYPRFPWLTIYTGDEYNMIPIEKEFSDIESIQIAEFNKGCVGDGNSIELTRDDDLATIIFSIGSGDCPAGCIYHKYWEFSVLNGIAEFVKTY
jgi:hypothetical protein